MLRNRDKALTRLTSAIFLSHSSFLKWLSKKWPDKANLLPLSGSNWWKNVLGCLLWSVSYFELTFISLSFFMPLHYSFFIIWLCSLPVVIFGLNTLCCSKHCGLLAFIVMSSHSRDDLGLRCYTMTWHLGVGVEMGRGVQTADLLEISHKIYGWCQGSNS